MRKVLLLVVLSLGLIVWAVVVIAAQFPQGNVSRTGGVVTGDTGTYLEYTQASSPLVNPPWVRLVQNHNQWLVALGLAGVVAFVVSWPRRPRTTP
jgi:hypothetical protein